MKKRQNYVIWMQSLFRCPRKNNIYKDIAEDVEQDLTLQTMNQIGLMKDESSGKIMK